MNKDLQLLVELQSMDIVLDKLRHQASDIPVAIDSNNSSINNMRSALDEAKNNVKRLQLTKKEKEMELETHESGIKKHSLELNSVKNNDAYKALLNEINTAKKAISSIEDDILNIMDSLEKAVLAVKEEENKLKSDEVQIQSKSGEMKSEFEKLTAEIQKLEAVRLEYTKQLPSDLLANYESIRANRQGIALVPLEGETCGGCGMNLRPQNINEIIKGKELITCDSCLRIVYRPIPAAEKQAEAKN